MYIDSNLTYLANRLNVSPSEMINKYASSTIDEIIEQETKKGNSNVATVVNEIYSSPAKIMEFFQISNTENKYKLLSNLDSNNQIQLLPLLEKEDLQMGLYFFTQEKLLDFLMKADIREVVNVVLEAFSPDYIIEMLPEEDIAKFFTSEDLEKKDVIEQMKHLPREYMEKFMEQITGLPLDKVNPLEIINQIEKMPDKQYNEFMQNIDPLIQRQLIFQLTDEKPEYYLLFNNQCYVDMLSTMLKPDMITPMIALDDETMMKIVSELPQDLLATVITQVDNELLAEFLADGRQDLLKTAILY